MSIQLYPYQETIVQKVRQSYANGYRAPCVVAPCGAGKSIIIAEIARKTTKKGNRVLFLVHRRELIDQIMATFNFVGVNLKLVEFGMVQTIVRKLDKIDKPQLIITDENHHGLAKSYRKIYDYFSDVPKLGFTATPVRLNGSGLGDINDKLIEEVDAKWLIENGYLSPYKYYAPKLIDDDKLKLNSLREFSSTSMDSALSDKKIYGDAIRHYKQLAEGEQAIVYCHSIAFSERLAEQFNAHGVAAAHIDGKTKKADRDDIIQKFRDQEIKVLTNVDLIGEGFDVPDCSTVIMLRPTESLSLFIQQSMRGMRYKAGKLSIIIDHVDNVRRHGLPDTDRTWSLEGRKKTAKENTVIVRECVNCYAVFPGGMIICPECGHEHEVEREETEYEVDETAVLEEVKADDIVLDFREPEDCTSMKELIELGENRGYKNPKGWAYYVGKSMGFVR